MVSISNELGNPLDRLRPNGGFSAGDTLLASLFGATAAHEVGILSNAQILPDAGIGPIGFADTMPIVGQFVSVDIATFLSLAIITVAFLTNGKTINISDGQLAIDVGTWDIWDWVFAGGLILTSVALAVPITEFTSLLQGNVAPQIVVYGIQQVGYLILSYG